MSDNAELKEWQIKMKKREEEAKLNRIIKYTNILDKWVNSDLGEAKFEFYCGGDSMGDTTLTFYNKEGVEVDDNDLPFNYNDFEDFIYDNVQFYDASDGHYMGEAGNVFVTYDKEEGEFIFNKDSEEEYVEREEDSTLFVLTDKEFEYLNNNVSNLNSSPWDSDQFNYKRDFILTDELGKLETELCDKIYSHIQSIDIELPYGGEFNDEGISYSTDEDFMSMNDLGTLELSEIFVDDEKVKALKIYFSVEYTIYKSGE